MQKSTLRWKFLEININNEKLSEISKDRENPTTYREDEYSKKTLILSH